MYNITMTKAKKFRTISLVAILLVGVSAIVTLVLSAILRPTEPSTEVVEEIEVAPAIPGDSKPYNFDYSWADEHPYVAHALGGILGDAYTNSYEAFLLNYQLGQRVFEVDLYLTEDDAVVAIHDDDYWHANTNAAQNVDFTLNNTHSYLIQNKYHALDYQQIIDLMVKYPDFYLITDTKYTDQVNSNHQFTKIVEYAKSVDESVLDRFIIQIYHQEMLDWVMAIYPWKSVIYTLYADQTWTPENVVTFSQESGVKMITMWSSLVSTEILDLWLPQGINIAAHTINDYGVAMDLFERGVAVVYTDFLIP